MSNLQATPEEEKQSIELIQEIHKRRDVLHTLEVAKEIAINNRDLDALVCVNKAIEEEEKKFEESASQLRALHQVWFGRINKVADAYGRR